MALYDPPPQLTAAQRVLAAVQADPEPQAVLLRLNSQQVRNLATLAAYLRGLPADYDRFLMTHYYAEHAPGQGFRGADYVGTAYAQWAVPECGTVACAIGHGPAAGLRPVSHVESWVQYALRVFGLDALSFTFAFGGGWGDVDDTPRGAAARICLLLDGCKGLAVMGGLEQKVRPPYTFTTDGMRAALPAYAPYLA